MRVTSRIRLLTAASVVVTSVAIAAIAFTGFRSLIDSQQESSLEDRVLAESERLRVSLHELQHDVWLLAKLPLIQSIAEETSAGGDPQTAAEHKKQLAQVFQEMVRAKPAYAQIRLIGMANGGREIVRVDRTADGIVRISEERLQRKGERDYFQETMQLSSQRIYLSQINLNREMGRIEVPHRPMLRAAVRVDSLENLPYGMIIINLDFEEFMGRFFGATRDRDHYYITNSDGDFLVHSEGDKTFGFDLGRRFLLQEDFPDLAGFLESEHESVTIRSSGGKAGDDTVLSFQKLCLIAYEPGRFLVLGISASGEELASGALAVYRRVVIATLLLVFATLAIAFLITRLLTQPIEKITLAARKLALGEEIPELPVQRSDEIGVLAQSFGRMAHSLRTKERELLDVNSKLSSANDDLEHFVHVAAHDLREPLRKQRNFIDLLKSEIDDSANVETIGMFNSVFDCSRHMQNMIDDFRALTKLGYGNPMREDADIKSLIAETLVEFETELQNRRVVVQFDPFPDRVSLYPPFVKRLYSNLVQNALDHGPRDGFDLRFTAKSTESGWLFGVWNSGSMIPESMREEVFLLFRKAGPTRSEGTGVGLSICRKIVERHRGKIFVESSNGAVHFQFSLGEKENEHQNAE